MSESNTLRPAAWDRPADQPDRVRVASIAPLGYSVEYGTYHSTIRLDHCPSKSTLTITPNLNDEPSEPIEVKLNDQDNVIIGAILEDWAKSL